MSELHPAFDAKQKAGTAEAKTDHDLGKRTFPLARVRVRGLPEFRTAADVKEIQILANIDTTAHAKKSPLRHEAVTPNDVNEVAPINGNIDRDPAANGPVH